MATLDAASANPILAHRWGLSKSEDRIWAEICGRAPGTRPWKRAFMAIQAYFDDSGSDGGVHVIAGYMATAEAWAAFSREWEQLLPLTYRGNSGNFRFKMSEMARRMDDVPSFFTTISNHVSFSASIMMSEKDLNNAKARIWSDNTEISWRPKDDPKNLLLQLFIMVFYEHCWQDERIRTWIGRDKIDLYFDTNIGEDESLEDWDSRVKQMPEYLHQIIGDKPRPVNDEEFMPIQAADLFAWWVRRGYEEGTIDKIIRGDFGYWQGKNIPGFRVYSSEDQLTTTLIDLFKRSAVIPALINVYDEKVKPRNHREMPRYDFEKRSHVLSYMEQKLREFRRRWNLCR